MFPQFFSYNILRNSHSKFEIILALIRFQWVKQLTKNPKNRQWNLKWSTQCLTIFKLFQHIESYWIIFFVLAINQMTLTFNNIHCLQCGKRFINHPQHKLEVQVHYFPATEYSKVKHTSTWYIVNTYQHNSFHPQWSQHCMYKYRSQLSLCKYHFGDRDWNHNQQQLKRKILTFTIKIILWLLFVLLSL